MTGCLRRADILVDILVRAPVLSEKFLQHAKKVELLQRRAMVSRPWSSSLRIRRDHVVITVDRRLIQFELGPANPVDLDAFNFVQSP